MIKLYGNGVYLVNGSRIIEDDAEAASVLNAECGSAPSKEEAAKEFDIWGPEPYMSFKIFVS